MKTALITGSIRSGTTWVGRMLGLSGRITHVFEPLNPLLEDSHQGRQIPFSDFHHIVGQNESNDIGAYVKYRIRYELMRDFREENISLGQKLNYSVNYLKNVTNIQLNRRIVIFKDPSALLSAEWFERFFKSKVVVLIRHPAAFIASIKRLNWPINSAELFLKEKLMTQLSPHLIQELQELKTQDKTVQGFDLNNTIVYWNVVHQLIHRMKTSKQEAWLFICHEDLSNDYIGGFKQIYNHVGLPWSQLSEDKIDQHCNASNIKDPASTVHTQKRDSRSATKLWKTILTSEEIKAIRTKTQEVSSLFYDEKEWE